MEMSVGRIRDERGATYVMALVFFLVCTVVAAVIIMAASVNAEHANLRSQREQAYLTLGSAAQMLSDDLAAQQPRCVLTVVTRTYACGYTHADTGVVSSTTTVTDADGAGLQDTALMAMVRKGATQVSAGGGAYSRTFTVSAPGLSDVEGTFAMDSAYDITIVLASSSADYAYTMTLSSEAVVSGPVSTSTVDVAADPHADGDWVWSSYEYEYWHGFFPDLYPIGDMRYGYYETTYYDITDTSTVTTVAWGATTITKGDGR